MRAEESQILSAFHEPAASSEPAAQLLVFDACQLGVVLRAVLFVEAVVAVASMYGAAGPSHWLLRASLITAVALPATLAWLIVACAGKRALARLPRWAQYLAGASLGALAGLYGCGMLALASYAEAVPWLAGASTGALMAALLVGGLELRARGRTPADTTARLAELQSRIRPHFLFNTLNSAIALVRAEPAKAEALLEDLSDLFRAALVEQGDSVTLDEEIRMAERYLAIEQVRFGDRLRIGWHLDPDADTARLPPLLLQPLVENAVRHGVEPSDSGADIEISTERRRNTVVIKVANTVPAGPGTPGHGVALNNVRDRLHLLHDVRVQFSAALDGGVFRVRIELPVGGEVR
ncbi:MAG: sensor histidine kinase [Burkholderiales bacterium]|nr:sensor histidine kinase [Burkholderiales bacterium]